MILTDSTGAVWGYLVGDVTAINTGNIGTVVNTKVAWQQAGGAPIVKVKPLRVPAGRRRTAHFKLPLSENGVNDISVCPRL